MTLSELRARVEALRGRYDRQKGKPGSLVLLDRLKNATCALMLAEMEADNG